MLQSFLSMIMMTLHANQLSLYILLPSYYCIDTTSGYFNLTTGKVSCKQNDMENLPGRPFCTVAYFDRMIVPVPAITLILVIR